MRRLAPALFGAVAALSATQVARAADMPFKAPAAPVAIAYNWNGFYLGAHAGYGLGVTKTTAPVDTDFFGGRGFIGGVLAGYNYVVAPRTLLGIEGDFSWSDIAYSATGQDGCCTFFTLKLTQKQAYSLRARFGVLLAPETLLYGTAGWSWSQFDYFLAITSLGTDADTRWFNGPQLGAGVETLIAPGWIARLEYLHTFYGNGAFNSPIVVANFGTGVGVEMRPSTGVARLALLYNFGAGKPPSPWQVPVAMPSWNGVYVGGLLGAGVGFGKAELVGAPHSLDGVGVPGIFPTAMIGYDWRVVPRWVIGAEAEVAPGISTADFAVDWTGALRARLGYLLTPTTMLYGTAGWVTTGIRTTSLLNTINTITVPSQRVNGAQFGGGIETAITEHWLARFDYQIAFAKLDNIAVNFGFFTGPVNADGHLHVARLGLIYLFDTR